MTNDESGRREIDPGAVIREALGPVPDDRVDWSGLHERVMRSAIPALGGRGIMVRWWEYLARWSMPAAPVAVAASLALLLVMPTSDSPDGTVIGGFLNDGLTESESAVFWSVEDDADVLLYAVFDFD